MINLKKFFVTDTGKYIVSIILGLGLATLFKNVCKDKNCLIYKAPSLEEIEKNTYQVDNKCYKYKLVQAKCNQDKNIINY